MTRLQSPSDAQSARPVNASLIADFSNGAFLAGALNKVRPAGMSVLVSDDPALQAALGLEQRLDPIPLGFEAIPIQFDQIHQSLEAQIRHLGAELLVVDMRWGLRTVSASANFGKWGVVCDQLVETCGVSIVSLYDRAQLIEDQFLAAFRGHSHFLAPSGLHENPYWLPPDRLEGTTLAEQLSFLLHRLVPDYAEAGANLGLARDAASGADPGWISTPRDIRPGPGIAEAWKIRCFGRLRIYLSDGSQIRWDVTGSSPRKSKALFAYLLQAGEKGARAEQLAELLWPDEPREEVKRTRLHHAIAVLRRTLGGKDHIRRTGGYYSLVPPPGTWIDIASFEQLCNRAKVLARDDQPAEAIALLDAADRLYSGDLFEDLGPEYVETDMEDWVQPRRVWLKEMAIKVQRDKAQILRHGGKLAEALKCCQKGLALDPVSEIVNLEAMQIYHAQGRTEAMVRHYRQYRAALEAIGAGDESSDIDDVYRELSVIHGNI